MRRLRLHLQCYAALAKAELAAGRLLRRLRPKLHYLDHLASEVARTHGNPMSQRNFLDEDNMKHLKAVAVACHPRTAQTAWSKRYLLKKVLLWKRLADTSGD